MRFSWTITCLRTGKVEQGISDTFDDVIRGFRLFYNPSLYQSFSFTPILDSDPEAEKDEQRALADQDRLREWQR